MIYRYIYFIAFLSALACNAKAEKDALPELIELKVIDSLLIEESKFHLNGQNKVTMIGDSLIAVSSIKTPSIGFYDVKGSQRKRIASGDYPIGSFLPSNFDASEYPLVYILDKKSESILVFDVEAQQFIQKIRLQFPANKQAKFVGSKFKKLKNGFLVELATNIYDNYDPNYYKEADNLIYYFDSFGKVKEQSFFQYPEEMKNIEGSLQPIDYLAFSSLNNTLLFSFPHSKKISRFSEKDFGKLIEEWDLPTSRYFDYDLLGTNQVISFQEIFASGEGMNIKIPSNHYFNSITETEKLIIIETWMNNRKEPPDYLTSSNLLVYNIKEERWYETSIPRNILDIGMLAGVVNDTLYFYEGSLMKQDEKYIKRAVLKPIEE